MNHTFDITYEHLLSDKWCRKCELNLQKVKNYAE